MEERFVVLTNKGAAITDTQEQCDALCAELKGVVAKRSFPDIQGARYFVDTSLEYHGLFLIGWTPKKNGVQFALTVPLGISVGVPFSIDML